MSKKDKYPLLDYIWGIDIAKGEDYTSVYRKEGNVLKLVSFGKKGFPKQYK